MDTCTSIFFNSQIDEILEDIESVRLCKEVEEADLFTHCFLEDYVDSQHETVENQSNQPQLQSGGSRKRKSESVNSPKHLKHRNMDEAASTSSNITELSCTETTSTSKEESHIAVASYPDNIRTEPHTDINDNEYVEAARIKREGIPENRDLTVLLVNDQNRNDYNTKIGRYHSVKPLIGLLTSTARTFIQDGVTTEFATQILGTTLDNGRIYAQLLTKSSLVLYNKPNNDDDPFIVQPTRVHSAFDGKWNVKQDLGIVDPDKFVLKNTDYLAPSSKMDIVYASKPAVDSYKAWRPSPVAYENQAYDNQIFEELKGRKVQVDVDEPKFEVYNFLDGPAIENEKSIELIRPAFLNTIDNLHRQSKAYEPVTEPMKEHAEIEQDMISETNVVKVKPDYDLPTFTIKNEFSPIFYYIDNVESRYSPQQPLPQTKTPKKLFGQNSEPKPKTTFTYAGFADFTTVVGDTVIIFTPNTETVRQPNPDEVNVFSVQKPVDNIATKITFLSADIPVATSTYKPNEIISATSVTVSTSSESSSEKNLYNDEDSLKKVLYNVDDRIPDNVQVKYNNGFDLNLDVIQPSEPVYTTTESTRNTEDIEIVSMQDFSSHATEPLGNVSPSATTVMSPKESVIIENSMNDVLTSSVEETENTAAEVTERNEEDNENENREEGGEEKRVDENEQNIMTTTESGHSDESYEIEVTTERKLDQHKEVFCTNGLETVSTMTTAYKTLTYLTTYFIPLESTETTTSIKSDVVVESNIGYLTNIMCKTDTVIEPTSVLTNEFVNTESSNIEPPSVVTEANTNQAIPSFERETNSNNMVTPPVEETEDLDNVEENTNNEQEVTTVTKQEEEEPQSQTTTTTTTESAVTRHSHIEMSVSTEHTPVDVNDSKEEELNESENEIDLIYKTLYTTYTYFTTFFGDQTSSVASHKSVITNIITSTVDLSNFDPSLLDAFNDDEIAPTSVSVPTETLAINSIIDLVKNKDVIESVEGDQSYSTQTPTPILGDDVIASIKPDGVKTYFTTYTFFTTIYVGSDANVCSRSEVYTNFVGPDELVPTKTNPISTESTRAQFDFRNCKQVKGLMPQNEDENSSVESSVSSEQDDVKEINEKYVSQPTPLEVDMLFSVESNPFVSENSFITDVKSSSSKGETKYLDSNNVLDDQISSESNIEEILPSPTLLLQTSYTTFTYFTTMYIGKDSSKVKSRLETITNVVTETISPKTEPEEENNLPITYYTTFTYWTTLYKDKSTTITSREEIVSNVVTPVPQSLPTVSPIDTTPIDVVSDIPQKDLLITINPSLTNDNLEQDDGKATFFTTYTYFTTFYAGNTSQIRSSLETVTNIVDNTKIIEDNQLGRKVPTGAIDKNLIQDFGDKPQAISPSKVKEVIEATILPNVSTPSDTLLQGTYIDNLFAEVKPVESNKSAPVAEKKILYSQVAVISGDSTIITNDNRTSFTETSTSTTTTTTENSLILTPTPEVIESSVADPESTTEFKSDSAEEYEDDASTRKKGRLTFTTKKPSFTPVIIPFASRNRPTFSPKRQPNSATFITRADFTPTITATPTLKAVRASSAFGSSRKQSATPSSSSSARKFAGRGSPTINLSANVPSSRPGASFGRAGSIQPTSRRTGFRSSSLRSNSIDFASRSASARIRPTASSRLRNGRQSSSVSNQPIDQNESETYATQQEETVTESLDEVTDNPRYTTNNPLLKFRRPPVARQPGTAIIPRSTTPAPRRSVTTRGRTTTTSTRRTTTRTTPNPLLSLRRQRPNSLFPKRNLFKQPEPELEEEIREEEQQVEESEELLEEEEDFEDNDYDASNRKEQQVATPPSPIFRKTGNKVQIRPFAFKRRSKRQVDYGSRKFTNFRRPALKSVSTRRPEPEPETEPPAPAVQKPKSGRRISANSRPTTATAPKASPRQPFIVRGESRGTTTSTPAYKRANSRASSRTTTHSSRPKAPRLTNKSTPSSRSSSSRATGRSRSRTTTSKASSRQRNSFENLSGERFNKYDNILNDGKITVTHHIPFEVTVPIVNGKITEYKNLLTEKPKIETLLLNQISTSIGILGNQQLVLAIESTGLAENGATKITKYVLHETPTTTVIFTPTTIRGRKTSYSHILPSTVYNVEPVVQTIAPEINSNVPLANLLLSQLLLGNQQPGLNPLLALQGQGLLPQQPVVQTPITEYKTRTTTYVTTVTDARETVLPITFRGIPILTTIVDPTTNVITATEYFTDTVVTTPTVLAPPPQYNSLLLPLLLQQQQQQQQALSLQTANPLLGLGQANFNLGQNNFLPNQNNLLLNDNLNNDIYSNSPKPNILSDLSSNEDFSEDIPIDESFEDTPPPVPTSPPTPATPPPAHTRKRHKHKAQKPPAPPSPPSPPSQPKITSVVTLYVSGKHPGEFSTVLSTVVSDDTQVVRKREAIYYEDAKILPSILPTIDQLSGSQDDSILENSIVSNLDRYIADPYIHSQTETQSLESIVGKLSDHVSYDASPTYVVKLDKPSSILDQKQSSVDDNS